MDMPFDSREWQPTKPPEPGDAQLSTAYISFLCQKLNHQTIDINQHPYDPNIWLRRTITLSRLRYPELAVGDAYKVGILCQAHISRLCERNGWVMGHRMGFWMYDETPHDKERVQKLSDHLAKLQERARWLISEITTLFMDDPEGRFRLRQYPWMHERHRWRSGEVLKSINNEFGATRANVMGDEPYCVLKRHAFGKGVNYSDTHELLGVFAACDIPVGKVILIDTTRVWGCNGPGANGDYVNLHGGIGCPDPVHPNAESDDTKLDLRWIRHKAGKHASSILRNCRLFLCCIEDGFQHPLDHPLIARMTPTYPKDTIAKFSLADDIAIPNEALRQFGVDVFANSSYDTWVLFTIEARARNNSCGDPTVDMLNPLFSLFNHSCLPNVEWVISGNHQSITATASKPISNGEQMFVQYDGFIADQPLDERRQRLWKWLDGPCRCTRCVCEEHIRPKHSDLDTEPKWDMTEKAVFPEDLLRLKN